MERANLKMLHARRTLLTAAEAASALGVRPKDLPGVLPPTVVISPRRHRYSPLAVAAKLEGAQQPEWDHVLEFIPKRLMNTEQVAKFLGVPEVIVPYLPLRHFRHFKGQSTQYSPDDVRDYMATHRGG